MPSVNRLVERLSNGPVVCAEGYVFELERRGYLKAGAFVPEVVVDYPNAVSELHREFLRAGSDVMVAMTYYAHRAKLSAIGREADLKALNKRAITLAKNAAKENDALVAGNICNTWVYDPKDKKTSKIVKSQYKEQIGWAKEGGVDFILAETIEYLGEALLALEAIQEAGLPAVVNLAPVYDKTKDGYGWIEACKELKKAGADVVGFNCARGPKTMLPLLKELRQVVDGPIAAVPVPYKTTVSSPAFQFLKNENGEKAFTLGLDSFLCNRNEIAEFTKEANKIGVEFLGVCCGAGPHHIRSMAEALGRETLSSKYSPDFKQHAVLGSSKYATKREKTFFQKEQNSQN